MVRLLISGEQRNTTHMIRITRIRLAWQCFNETATPKVATHTLQPCSGIWIRPHWNSSCKPIRLYLNLFPGGLQRRRIWSRVEAVAHSRRLLWLQLHKMHARGPSLWDRSSPSIPRFFHLPPCSQLSDPISTCSVSGEVDAKSLQEAIQGNCAQSKACIQAALGTFPAGEFVCLEVKGLGSDLLAQRRSLNYLYFFSE